VLGAAPAGLLRLVIPFGAVLEVHDPSCLGAKSTAFGLSEFDRIVTIEQ
jgi:hypothetical protein